MNVDLPFLMNDSPFQTTIRQTNADGLGLMMFFLGLIALVVLMYRNPQVLSSLFIRAFKSNSEKLYFSAPVIDSVDKILLYLIYFSGGALCMQFFELNHYNPYANWLIYLIPLLLLIYFVAPFYCVSILFGLNKYANHILRKQSALLFLFGVILISLGGFVFVDFISKRELRLIFLSVLLIVIIWIHFRVFRELVTSGVSIYYIFIYFCTLELLPIAFLWVLISRF